MRGDRAARQRDREGHVLAAAAEPRVREAQTPGRDEARSEEHTSELQSLMRISYAVFCLKKKKHTNKHHTLNPYRQPAVRRIATTNTLVTSQLKQYTINT